MKLARLASLAAALLAALALLPGPASAAAPLQKIKVAYVRSLPMIPQAFAEQQGYFKAQGLDAEIITLNTGPAVVSAVVSGSADIGFTATVPMILARAEHQPIRIFVALNYEQYPSPEWVFLAASKASGVTAMAGLKGKTIAINTFDGACDLLVRDHLRQAGIALDQVKIISIPFPQMQAALQLGNADAACIIQPFLTSMEKSEKIQAHVLAGGVVADLQKYGRVTLDGYFARPDWLAKNQKAAAGFMRAILEANRTLAKDLPLYRKLTAASFKMPPAMLDALPGAFNITSLVTQPGEYTPLIDALTRTKMLRNPITAKDLIYPIHP